MKAEAPPPLLPPNARPCPLDPEVRGYWTAEALQADLDALASAQWTGIHRAEGAGLFVICPSSVLRFGLYNGPTGTTGGITPPRLVAEDGPGAEDVPAGNEEHRVLVTDKAEQEGLKAPLVDRADQDESSIDSKDSQWGGEFYTHGDAEEKDRDIGGGAFRSPGFVGFGRRPPIRRFLRQKREWQWDRHHRRLQPEDVMILEDMYEFQGEIEDDASLILCEMCPDRPASPIDRDLPVTEYASEFGDGVVTCGDYEDLLKSGESNNITALTYPTYVTPCFYHNYIGVARCGCPYEPPPTGVSKRGCGSLCTTMGDGRESQSPVPVTDPERRVSLFGVNQSCGFAEWTSIAYPTDELKMQGMKEEIIQSQCDYNFTDAETTCCSKFDPELRGDRHSAEDAAAPHSEPLIIAASDVIIQCGIFGDITASCIFQGGIGHIVVAENVRNLTISGVTFRGANGISVVVKRYSRKMTVGVNSANTSVDSVDSNAILNEESGLVGLEDNGLYSMNIGTQAEAGVSSSSSGWEDGYDGYESENNWDPYGGGRRTQLFNKKSAVEFSDCIWEVSCCYYSKGINGPKLDKAGVK